MNLVSIIFMFILLFHCQNNKVEDGWKKIKVFETNRIEVEKILGTPINNGFRTSYNTSEAIIHIDYSGVRCGNSEEYGVGYDIPKDTVFSYLVYPKKKPKLSDLNWDKNSYEREQNKHHSPAYVYYYSATHGIYITAVKIDLQNENSQIVKSIRYGRTQKQYSKYKCENGEQVQIHDPTVINNQATRTARTGSSAARPG